MNKLVAGMAAKKAANAAAEAAATVTRIAEEEVIINRRTLTLEIAVALLGGMVLGMFLSPRKTVTYKIASNNRINDGEDEDEGYAEDDDAPDEEEPSHGGRFIKL